MTTVTKAERGKRDLVARALDAGLPMAGVAVVLSAVLLAGGGWTAIWVTVGGLLLVEAGVWRLGSRVVYERKYQPLRDEVQRFVGLARELHHASLAAENAEDGSARVQLDGTIRTMRASLDRMVVVAGKTEADVEAVMEPVRPAVVPAAPAAR